MKENLFINPTSVYPTQHGPSAEGLYSPENEHDA